MNCTVCNNTGWCSSDVNGVERVERCECWHRQVAMDLLRDANIPARYQKCNFSTFVTYPNEQLLRAVKRAEEFSDSFPVVQKGLLLIGPPGIGKTHLAVSVLRNVIVEKNIRGVYFDTRSLLSAIRSSYNPVTRTSEADILERVMQAELLVLDDLGAERLTEWVEETMHLIVNTRYNDRRPTIFTSNYEDEQDDPDSLKSRVGFRMHSRLREMCEFLEYSGPDYRDFEFKPDSDDIFGKWKAEKSQPKRRLPRRTSVRARAQLKEKDGQLELGWLGGKASS